MLVTFLIVQEPYLNLRYQSQTQSQVDRSVMQTQLKEAEFITTAGGLYVFYNLSEA